MRSSGIILCVLYIMGQAFVACRNSPPDESPQQDRINYTDKSGSRQGPWEIREDSILTAKGSFKNGKPEGQWTYWYPNGNMKEEGRYKKGVKTGMWVEWYSDGEMMWKGEYVNGKRHIGEPEAKPEIRFIGEVPEDHVLLKGHTYRLSIRIPNVPSGNLFVECDKGSVDRDAETGHYILETPADTILTLAIGFIPELEFRDFRNLVAEVDFKIR